MKDDFKDLFDLSKSSYEKSPNPSNITNSFSNLSKDHFLLFQLLFGCFLIIISIIMITQMIFFGPFVWWIALTYGIILIVRAFNQDFSNHNRNTVVYNLKEHRFALNREFTFKFRFIIFKNIKSLMIRKWYRKLDFFDMTAIIGLLIFLPVQQFQGWMLADTLPLILDNVFSTVVMFIILTLIFLFVCLPVNVIELKTSSITYRIQTSLKSEEKSLLKKMVLHFLEKVKSISDQAMKRVFLIRVASISSIIIGVCIYMIIYFNFFF